MLQGLRRPRGTIVQREIQYLIRAFPSKYVVIYRETAVYDPDFGQRLDGQGARTPRFAGEVTVIPAGGVVELYGGGQTERKTPTLILTTHRDVQQGDYVELDGRTYQVEYPIDHFGYYVEVRLQQYRQAI